ncbi:MAG: CheR family methyltransferase [Acidobacteriota bacterium]
MPLAALEDLLKTSMGLSAASIGSSAIARAVQERLSACGLADAGVYLTHVRASGTELQALIEAVVVPETWFFRDSHPFAALARLALEQWLPAHSSGTLSLLSVPCSTGEEPYSMAMALGDAGIPPGRFHVDAVDISARHLAQGTRAVYGRNSFRTADLGFRDRHFDLLADGYQLRDSVRRQVRFQQANLFAADFLPGLAIYDVIFCRNVLIYFDRPTQDRAIDVLSRLLRDDGVLFVAPAETALPASHGMISTNEPLAFAFRKRRAAAPPRPIATPTVSMPRPRMPLAPTPRPGAPLATPVLPTGSSARRWSSQPQGNALKAAVDRTGDLPEAVRLANQGHFDEAAIRCEAHLRLRGPSAGAFHLMGLVRDATGNQSEAAAFYRKALYLDPNYYDAQIHLALLLEKQGDAAGAKVLRERAQRLEHTQRTSRE